MAELIGYVVVTYNQASHWPELANYGELYYELGEAVAGRELAEAQTRAVGRGERHAVAEVLVMEATDGE